MNMVCEQCGIGFEVTGEDLEFLKKVSPIFNGKKCQIPVPKICPLCRQQRRFAFRNERKLYNRTCDMTGKPIITIYSPDKPYKVYDQEEWWSDKWDALDYGRDVDFSKSFSEQLRALYVDVPHVSLYNTNTENSYFTNFALNQKNSYLIFGSGNAEDCMYGKYIVDCKDIVDCLAMYSCELCYEGVASENCYNCKFFVNSRNCSDCLMVEDCSSCKNCIACFGLRSKEYCVMNQQYTREEYENLSKDYEYLTNEKIKSLRKLLDQLKSSSPHIQSHIFGSENCTGDGIYNCKNTVFAFDCKDCENCKYMYASPNCVETQDCAYCAPYGVRFSYNVCSTVDIESSMVVFFVWYGSNIYYSLDCHHCNDVFGCVGLKNKKYCILNKQYSKEEYEKLAFKIADHMIETGEWGEYFPYSISPFAYNETIANEYFPLNEEDVLKLGAKWKDLQDNFLGEGESYHAPEDIRDVDEIICGKVLRCKQTGRQFKIIPQELKYYKRMGLPIPEICPDQRHYERLKYHNNYRLWDGNCDRCAVGIKTIHSSSDSKTVFCEKCYLEEVY